MGYFPFFMEMEGKRGVIVGGGKVAARKVEKLLAFGPELTVIASDIEMCVKTQGELLQKDAAGSLRFEERAFLMEDLRGADFVIAATDDAVLNGEIADYCKAQGILVNVADDREKCTFFFPALIKDGALTIGISTDGKSPFAASWAQREIAGMLPEGIGSVVDLMGQVRPAVMRTVGSEDARKSLFGELFCYCMDCMEKGHGVTAEELTELVETWRR
jgi:siroheme synthase-like protein